MKIFLENLLRQDYREVMRITINQSQLISSARCVTPRRVVSMITKKQANALVL